MDLTQADIEAFKGLDESYKEMDRHIMKSAPKCHMTPMSYVNESTELHGLEIYWFCEFCGHTKEVT